MSEFAAWALAVVLAVTLVGLGIAAIGGVDCPKGQELTVTAWYPLTINGVVTLQPMYECEPKR